MPGIFSIIIINISIGFISNRLILVFYKFGNAMISM